MGEECWLCFNSDDHQVTDMPLLLTRMFGHMMNIFVRGEAPIFVGHFCFVRGEAPIFVEDTFY
jgi:hypothetical protein